ncbi:MAG: acetate kinase [bacterium]|nr:acetate kinase [bacterium]
MKILVVNCGSSSLKYQLFDMEKEEVIAKGIIERIGTPPSYLTYSVNGEKKRKEVSAGNHTEAFKVVIDTLLNGVNPVISSIEEIKAVGHRVVHGGEKFKEPTIIDDEVIAEIEKNNELAPLHNPAGLAGIRASMEVLPNVHQTAVFDTSFHSNMPKYAYLYAIPMRFYRDYRIRRYGFHGTSHYYVANRAAQLVGRPIEELKIVTCHLGNGCSISAVKGGRSIDTSMGFTPLEGLIMGTRSGDLDPAIPLYLMRNLNYTAEEVDDILNKESGLLGISEFSNDMRDIMKAAEEGNQNAKLAMEMFCYRIKKYIGAYTAIMNGLDVLVFTAGIGENEPEIREMVCDDMDYLGIKIDPQKNNFKGQEKEISASDSKVKVWVIPTNEELVIARETARLIS